MNHFHIQIRIPRVFLVTAALTFSHGHRLEVALQLVSARPRSALEQRETLRELERCTERRVLCCAHCWRRRHVLNDRCRCSIEGAGAANPTGAGEGRCWCSVPQLAQVRCTHPRAQEKRETQLVRYPPHRAQELRKTLRVLVPCTA